MNESNFDIALNNIQMDGFLKNHEQLLQNYEWNIKERLWIYQLDRDGFLVSGTKFFPQFLKELFYQGIGFVSLKGVGNYYYLVLKVFLNTHPEIKYTSQLRLNTVGNESSYLP